MAAYHCNWLKEYNIYHQDRLNKEKLYAFLPTLAIDGEAYSYNCRPWRAANVVLLLYVSRLQIAFKPLNLSMHVLLATKAI